TSPGALYDADFISSFLLVKRGIRSKQGTLRDRLWRCAGNGPVDKPGSGALDKKDAALLDHAAELCRTVEHAQRLVIGRKTRWLREAEMPGHEIEKLTSQILRREFSQGLEQELLTTFRKVREIYDDVIV